MSQCCVCEEETNKYKCVKCKDPYCSLKCYKEHQKIGCEDKSIKQTDATPNAEDEIDMEPTVHGPFTTDDTVPPEKLEELRNSEPLRRLLYNPHLRQLLQQIDIAPNAWKAMQAAMQEPLFVEFADECLKVVEPMTEEEKDELRRTTA